MASLNYNDIYSRFYTKVEAYDFITLDDDQVNEFICNWLHSALNNPYVRRLFSTLSLDDEVMTMTYSMKYVIDEEADKEFVIELAALGVGLQWLEPKINSILNITQVFSHKDAKYYSQASHLDQLRGLRNDFNKKLRRMIADRGYAWNTYLDGE